MTAEQMIALLSAWVIKPLLILLVVLVGAWVLRKTSAALQHFWLFCGLVALLILPLLSLLLPILPWAILPDDGSVASSLVAQLNHLMVYLSSPPRALVLLGIYLLPAFSLLFYFLLGVLQVYQQQRFDVQCDDPEINALLPELYCAIGVSKPVTLRLGASVASPHMWGVWRPVIRLPLAATIWSSERKLAVLIHELAHVVRGDWASMVLVKIACAMFWFLPPVWWLAARLDDCAEMACDDFIYRLHDKHIAYAENLLALSRPQIEQVSVGAIRPEPHQPVPAMTLPMAGHSPLYHRIQAVLDTRRPRNPVAVERDQYWVLALLLLLLPLAAVQVMPIREVLQLRLLNVQNASTPAPVVESSPPVEPGIRLIDVRTLREIKQSLLSSDLPRQRIGHTEVIRVVADRPLLNSQTPSIDIALPTITPVISIEGYMPLHIRVPKYPLNALQRGIEGEVIVRFDIDENGRILSPEIIHASPRRVFERAVLAALEDSRYLPQRIDGQPVLLKGVIENFTFQLAADTGDPRRQ